MNNQTVIVSALSYASIAMAALCPLSLLAQTNSSASVSADGSATTLPEVVVTDHGAKPVLLQEERPVGPYQQPEWTTARRFTTTRIYVQQTPWSTGFEQWVRMTRSQHGGGMETRMQEELEIGLPYRFQLDLYETWAIDQIRNVSQDEYSGEMRYALADWGKIPLNPTLYFEYAQHDHDANTVEGKLLFGGDLAPAWHWGLNLICEQELGGKDNTELAVSQGISRTVIDERLSAGMEMNYANNKANGSQAENEFLIGPSFQWRPTSWSHIDLTPLFGCTPDSPAIQAFLVIGIDFGTGSSKKEHYAPTSLQSE